MSLEHFHSELKNIYLKGRMNSRLDSLIQNLSEKANNDTVARYDKITKNTATEREADIKKNHKSAVLVIQSAHIRPGDEGAGKWMVKSQSGEGYHEVVLDRECPNVVCLKCKFCHVCEHMIKCSCTRYSQGDLCSHIHAIGHYYQGQVRLRFPPKARLEGAQPEMRKLRALINAGHKPQLQLLREMAVNMITAAPVTLSESQQSELYKGILQGVVNRRNARNSGGTISTPVTSRPWNKLNIHQRSKYKGSVVKRRRLIK